MEHYIKSEAEYRAESDQRTMLQAAEIVADSVRLRSMIRQQEKVKESLAGLDKMLTKFRRGGSFRRKPSPRPDGPVATNVAMSAGETAPGESSAGGGAFNYVQV